MLMRNHGIMETALIKDCVYLTLGLFEEGA